MMLMVDASPSSTRSATPRRSTTRLVPVSADATRSSVAQPRHIQDKDGCNVRHDSESSSMYSTLLFGRLRAGCRMLCSVRVQPRRRSFLKERRCTDSDPVNSLPVADRSVTTLHFSDAICIATCSPPSKQESYRDLQQRCRYSKVRFLFLHTF